VGGQDHAPELSGPTMGDQYSLTAVADSAITGCWSALFLD